jgi:dynactin complex subunit
LKLNLQDLSRFKEYKLEKKELEKELAKCRVQIVSESNKLNDEHIDRSLDLKNKDR